MVVYDNNAWDVPLMPKGLVDPGRGYGWAYLKTMRRQIGQGRVDAQLNLIKIRRQGRQTQQGQPPVTAMACLVERGGRLCPLYSGLWS